MCILNSTVLSPGLSECNLWAIEEKSKPRRVILFWNCQVKDFGLGLLHLESNVACGTHHLKFIILTLDLFVWNWCCSVPCTTAQTFFFYYMCVCASYMVSMVKPQLRCYVLPFTFLFCCRNCQDKWVCGDAQKSRHGTR